MENSTTNLSKRKTYLSVFLILMFVTVCLAATYTTTTTGGNWAATGTWSGGAVPPNWGSHTVNINGNVSLTATTTSINGFTAINLNAGKTFTSGTSMTPNNLSMQSVTFNVVSGNITVYGNLTLDNSALTLTAGTLTVTGTLTLTNGASIVSNSSGAISAGAVLVDNSSTLTINNGSLAVTNALTINSGTVTIAQNKSLTAGSFTVGNNSNAILNNSGSTTINGNVSESGKINNLSTGVMQINGNLTMVNTSSAIFTNTGYLTVTGNLTIPGSAKFNVNPDGETFINGNVTVTGNENLIVGTNVSPTPYADMVIRQNLILTGSGDVLVEKNGRFAVFGDVTSDTSGGSNVTLKSGGQMYVDGNMSFTGGGDHIINNNASAPYGLYTDGTVSYTGGGSGTIGPAQGNVPTLQTEDPPFYAWVSNIPSGPLPIKLLYFKVSETRTSGISLEWVTSFEKNFDYFQVERAGEDLAFKAIDRIDEYGGLNVNTLYEYFDPKPLAGKNYYRLKSVDLNNSFEYSPVVYADWNFKSAVSVYPNPISAHKFSINLNDNFNSPTQLQLLDASGNQVFHEIIGGSSVYHLSNDIKPGFYFLRIYSGTQQEIVKVIVN